MNVQQAIAARTVWCVLEHGTSAGTFLKPRDVPTAHTYLSVMLLVSCKQRPAMPVSSSHRWQLVPMLSCLGPFPTQTESDEALPPTCP